MLERIISSKLEDYLESFSEYRTNDSDFFVKMALQNNGRVYILQRQKQPVGYLVVINNVNNMLVNYSFVKPEFRQKGIFTSLMKHALKHCKTRLRVNITDKMEAFPIVQRVCRKLKFVQGEKLTVYRGKLSEAYPYLQEYLSNKGNRLLKLLERFGITTCSFADATQEQLEYLRNSGQNEFKNSLSVQHFLDAPQQRKVNFDLSFMALQNGVPIAYVLVISPDAKSAIFEQISTSKAVMTSGVILMPFVASLEASVKNDIERVRYAMFEDNVHANNFRKNIIDCMHLESYISYMYLK